MKIILLRDIKNLGRKFDIKQVKNGYARNFLLPQGLVKIATEKTIKELEAQKLLWEKEEQTIKEKLEILAKDLARQEFNFKLKTGKKKEVFGSVNRDDIKTRILADFDADSRRYLDDIEIKIEHPIKTLGEHSVEIDFGRGVKAKIKVIVEGEK